MANAGAPSPLQSLFDWLLDGAPGATAPEVIARVGELLRAHGVPVDRLSAFVTTLHPSIGGRAFRCLPGAPGSPVEITELPHGLFDTGAFRRSAVAIVRVTGKEIRVRVGPSSNSREYPILDELASEGYTDYVAFPLVFTDGQTHVVTVASRAPAGFTEADLDAMRSIIRPLARVTEILALRRTASNLLSTYVGRNSGDRILAGHIQKGDFETIRAVIWFSDLRGFTEMSSRLPAGEVIATLNSVFGCQVSAIEKRGGEVLKFMGDGMLAIFPLGPSEETEVAREQNARTLCNRAIEAGIEAVAALASLGLASAEGTLPPSRPLRIGLALHIGELAYGNIGGANRLDFTAIGPAVNLAARLEGITARLGRSLVVSEAVARLTTRATRHVGTFTLKGLPAPVPVFVVEP